MMYWLVENFYLVPIIAGIGLGLFIGVILYIIAV